jgi:hypothetical protein
LALAGNTDVKMTGERGEASVLFSLAAVKGEAPPAQPSEPAMGENSGMIDMRALMNARVQNPHQAPVPGGRVDDIMNLSPGGMLAGSLAPPVLSAVTSTPANAANAVTGVDRTSNRSLIAGACVLVVGVLAAAAASVFTLQQEQRSPQAPSPIATPTVTTQATGATSGAAPVTIATASTPTPVAPKFNVEAAKAELSKIATTLGTCKKAGGPTGSGKVMLTFSNDGKVEAARLDGKPFAKTPVGECVLARFSEAKVPAFGGGTQPTEKTFTIK